MSKTEKTRLKKHPINTIIFTIVFICLSIITFILIIYALKTTDYNYITNSFQDSINTANNIIEKGISNGNLNFSELNKLDNLNLKFLDDGSVTISALAPEIKLPDISPTPSSLLNPIEITLDKDFNIINLKFNYDSPEKYIKHFKRFIIVQFLLSDISLVIIIVSTLIFITNIIKSLHLKENA